MQFSFMLLPHYDPARDDDFDLHWMSRFSLEGDLGDGGTFLRSDTSFVGGPLDDETTNRTHEGISSVSSNADVFDSHESARGLYSAFSGSSLTSASTHGLADGRPSRPASWPEPAGVSAEDRPSNLPIWHPFWLRTAVIVAFTVLFACLAASLVTITVYSQLNDGLSNSHEGMAYVHRFGPTACEISPPSTEPCFLFLF